MSEALPTAIHALIPEVMRRVGAIRKDKTNKHQSYKYRSIDQFYEALQPVFAELGIFVLPLVQSLSREERPGKGTGINIWTVATVQYQIYGPSGDKVTAIIAGEAFDSGDKGCNKALSAALKYLLTQVFLIPTDDLVDADAESPEIQQAPKWRQQLNKVEARDKGDLGIEGFLELVKEFNDCFSDEETDQAVTLIKKADQLKLDPNADGKVLIKEMLIKRGVEVGRVNGKAVAKFLTPTIYGQIVEVFAIVKEEINAAS